MEMSTLVKSGLVITDSQIEEDVLEIFRRFLETKYLIPKI